jgi:hypothetical protein
VAGKDTFIHERGQAEYVEEAYETRCIDPRVEESYRRKARYCSKRSCLVRVAALNTGKREQQRNDLGGRSLPI